MGKHSAPIWNAQTDYVVTIVTTTLSKRVSFLVSSVESIAETDNGTTIHLDSGRHLTTELSHDKVFSLVWPNARLA